MSHRRASWLCLAALGGVVLLLGCSGKNKTNSDPAGPTGNFGPGPGPGGPGPGGPAGVGPGGGRKKDLSAVGKEHDVAWISDHIRNAKSHTPMSRMPPFPPDKISDDDLRVLAQFLAGDQTAPAGKKIYDANNCMRCHTIAEGAAPK